MACKMCDESKDNVYQGRTFDDYSDQLIVWVDTKNLQYNKIQPCLQFAGRHTDNAVDNEGYDYNIDADVNGKVFIAYCPFCGEQLMQNGSPSEIPEFDNDCVRREDTNLG